MNFYKQALILTMSLISTASFAEDKSRDFYLGLKAGSFLIDVSGVDNTSTFGVQVGVDFRNNWSIEAEYNSGSSDLSGGVDLDFSSMAMYGTYRSEGPGYFLGKIGIVKVDFEVSKGNSTFDADDADSDDSGLSYGFGGGYNFNKQFGVEAEYTLVDADVSLIAVTARFMF